MKDGDHLMYRLIIVLSLDGGHYVDFQSKRLRALYAWSEYSPIDGDIRLPFCIFLFLL